MVGAGGICQKRKGEDVGDGWKRLSDLFRVICRNVGLVLLWRKEEKRMQDCKD